MTSFESGWIYGEISALGRDSRCSSTPAAVCPVRRSPSPPNPPTRESELARRVSDVTRSASSAMRCFAYPAPTVYTQEPPIASFVPHDGGHIPGRDSLGTNVMNPVPWASAITKSKSSSQHLTSKEAKKSTQTRQQLQRANPHLQTTPIQPHWGR